MLRSEWQLRRSLRRLEATLPGPRTRPGLVPRGADRLSPAARGGLALLVAAIVGVSALMGQAVARLVRGPAPAPTAASAPSMPVPTPVPASRPLVIDDRSDGVPRSSPAPAPAAPTVAMPRAPAPPATTDRPLPPATRPLYRWTDERGGLHVTDSIDQVPEARRAAAHPY